MQRFLIITTNCALLILLLIGLPAATRGQLGNVQFSSASTGRLLMFWGLGGAAAANVFTALFFAKGRQQKIICWEWAAVFGGLLAVQFAYTHGYLNFEWLKHALQWVQKHF